MAGQLLNFVCRIPERGFSLLRICPTPDEGKAAQTFLVPTRVSGEVAGERTFGLLDLDVVPYRVFAETDPTSEGILAFANTFGPLGIAVEMIPQPQNRKAAGPEFRGEPMDEWRWQIALMSQLVAIWDVCRADDTARLTRHFRWQKDDRQRDRVIFSSHVEAEDDNPPSTLGIHKARVQIDPAGLDDVLQRRLEPGDALVPALGYLQRRLDEQLRQLEHNAAPFMTWDASTKLPVLRFTASTLASALWLQFADAVAYNRTYDRCQVCQKWFEVAPDAARSHRRFCSDACRVKAYRDRQGLARRLHFEEHKSFEEIAEELDSKVNTVRRWITGR